MAELKQKRGSAAWFLTEQARCLAQAGRQDTGDYLACQMAAEYLAGDDKKAMDDFLAKIEAVKVDPDVDCDTEDYTGKDRDLAGALYTLLTRAGGTDTPEQAKAALVKGAGVIAAFYGADLELTA